MRQEKLALENLPKLENGVVVAAFDAELKRLVRDCDERPLDDKPRSLTLTLKLTPKAEMSGRGVVCEEVNVECEISGKVPVQRTKVYTMKPKQDGSLAFHPDLPTEPDGSTMYDEDQIDAAKKANGKAQR
jgi:hypothetical protein